MFNQKTGNFESSKAFDVLSGIYGAKYQVDPNFPELTNLTYTRTEIARLVLDLIELQTIRDSQTAKPAPLGLIGFSNGGIMMNMADILNDCGVTEIIMRRADATGRWNVDLNRKTRRSRRRTPGEDEAESENARLRRTVAVQARRLSMLEDAGEEARRLTTYSEALTREILEKFRDAPYTDDLSFELMESFSRKIAEHQMWAEMSIAEADERREKLNQVKKHILPLIPKNLLSGEPAEPVDVTVPYSAIRPILVALGWKDAGGEEKQ